MAFKSENFSLSGPLHLTTVDWANAHYCRTVAACLVHGVYILEQDRRQNRKGHESLAPPWWKFFHFHLFDQFIGRFSIFGAIFEFRPPRSNNHPSNKIAPRYVIAFRGTIIKLDSFFGDMALDILIIRNGLHKTSHFEIGMQAVRNMVTTLGASNVWLAGHSLGSAMAMLVGKNMAKTGVFLQTFLFNPPFVSAPYDDQNIKSKKLQNGIRKARRFITAGLTVAMKGHSQKSGSEDPFVILSPWVPSLFVHPTDNICSEYVGYFAQRKKMEKIGASGIEKLATQNSIVGLLLVKKESEPLHLLHSASLTINLSQAPNLWEAHALCQWWIPDQHLQCNLYQY
ncbi:hypothetical protein NE237_028260 [Protea cynaroides]|uniref:Fungal lipase-type domain-containing protein n=1 Tax=Protea cynaroides TaxID=273540 RepID=A0A9Q0GRP0_9MAGN|nr:hypothetical protein NE237_028260 [Protea cynaroides]